MPSAETNIVQSVSKAIQYTGTNSGDIDLQVPNCTIISESGGVLTLDVNGRQFTVATNGWVFWNAFIADSLSNSQYHSEWGCVALCSEMDAVVADLDDVSDDVSLLQAAGAVRAMGVAPVPSLVLNATATVAVQLQPAMPSSSYSAYASLFAGISITSLQINSVTVVDSDTVNVVVQNVGLATLAGANVMVHAVD